MSHGFIHHAEAQSYASSVTDPRARVALGIVHHLLLESGGMRRQLLPERYYPTQTLDVLYFYKTVERLFAEWTEGLRSYPETTENRDRLSQVQESEAMIRNFPTERTRIGLTNYLSILKSMPVPERTVIDTLFCSRLLAVLLSHSDLLERILSGDESWAAINPWDGILS